MEQIFKPASKEEIKQRQEKYLSVWVAEFVKRSNITKNSDGSFDVDGSVDLSDMNLTKIPLKFRKVAKYFNCSYNKLVTLENSPEYVGGHFLCSFNNLITLENSPKYVGGYFWCNNNPKLKSLEGIGEVKGYIYSSIKK